MATVTVPAPAVQLVDVPMVQLTGQAVLDVRAALVAVLRQGRLDGINPSPRIRHLLDALDAACNVPADIPDPRAGSGDPQSGMTSAQAAAALGVSERHARRLAPSLNAHRRGHRLLFDASTVHEYAREKAC